MARYVSATRIENASRLCLDSGFQYPFPAAFRTATEIVARRVALTFRVQIMPARLGCQSDPESVACDNRLRRAPISDRSSWRMGGTELMRIDRRRDAPNCLSRYHQSKKLERARNSSMNGRLVEESALLSEFASGNPQGRKSDQTFPGSYLARNPYSP